tara:strand:+ start:396 stop:1160 length:765 start_codon:yes stop_codon:yes gene_type:complete
MDFFKYQATGNDFILIDDRLNKFEIDNNYIKKLCNRKYGIGADGLILFRNHKDYDFEMIYFNSDGFKSTMCGNGGRCIVSFANYLDPKTSNFTFKAIDGVHTGSIDDKNLISISMKTVDVFKKYDDMFFFDTGSPHIVKLVTNLNQINVKKDGYTIRNLKEFKKEGVNVNFLEIIDNKIFLRTYERGVENETLSCGTGAVAGVLCAHQNNLVSESTVEINSLGGKLYISFSYENNKYCNINLCGETSLVFKGKI